MKKFMIYGFRSEMTGAWVYCARHAGDLHCSYVGSWLKAVQMVAVWQGRKYATNH